MLSLIFTLLVYLLMLIAMLSPYLIVIAIFWLRHKRNKEAAIYAELARQREIERNEREQEELELKKQKFKRKRCSYCGRLNLMDAPVCFSCGGVFEETKEEDATTS